MTFKSIESIELVDGGPLAFPVGGGDAYGGPLYRFLAYVPAGTTPSFVQAAMGAWGVPVRVVTHPLPTDWPWDDLRLLAETARAQGKTVSTTLPGPDYVAVRGEFVGTFPLFATKVLFEPPPGDKGMYPVQIWRGPDVKFGQPATIPTTTPEPAVKETPITPGTPGNAPITETGNGPWSGMGDSIQRALVALALVGAAGGGLWWLYKRNQRAPAHARENPTKTIKFRGETYVVPPEHGPVNPKIDRILLAKVANMGGAISSRGGAPSLSPLSGRSTVIRWLQWNDPNGNYSDSEVIRENQDPLTLEETWELLADVIQDDIEEYKTTGKLSGGSGYGHMPWL